MRADWQGNPRRLWLAGGIAVVLLLIICRLIVLVQEEKKEQPEALKISVLDKSGVMRETELNLFLTGVVAAEMPASFETEALKAQAVAARTYIARRMQGEGKHGAAAVCCDPACCQAYMDVAELQQLWGLDFEQNYERVRAAVEQTGNLVLSWQGALAETPYSSTCGGSTEDAAAVWGGSRPYLQSVDCDWDAHAARFSGFRRLTLAEAASLLEVAVEDLYAMTVTDLTPGARVGNLRVGEQNLKGTELRQRLMLNSACFQWLIIGDYIVFTTVGYGHGVGLCQYGADGMARAGFDFAAILTHYFPGTELLALDAM